MGDVAGNGNQGSSGSPPDDAPVTRRDLREGIAELRAEVHVGFVEVNKRLDNLIQILGDRYRGGAPHVGQVVLYRLRDGRWFPAVVLQIHEKDALDLEVFGAASAERYPERAAPGFDPGFWRNPQ